MYGEVEKPIYLKRKLRRRVVIIVSSICSVILTVFILIAFAWHTVDRFTITTDENSPELSLTIDENKEEVTTQLIAPPLIGAKDIQYSDLPLDIEAGLGSKNTNYYFAYSFYLGGTGEAETINYSLTMVLNQISRNLEKAIRIMIVRNEQRKIYAQPNDDGTAKLIYSGENKNGSPEVIGSTIPFKDNVHIILEPYSIKPNEYDRFTVVMWIDGWESADSMRGGTFQANMEFSTISNS